MSGDFTDIGVGRDLAALQHDLATMWREQGADAVHEQLSSLDPNVWLALSMANIGAKALSHR